MSNPTENSINYDDLFLSISHELRAPLGHIVTLASMLEENANIAPMSQTQEDVKRIQLEAKRVLAVVDRVLELVHIETMPLRYMRMSLHGPIQEALTSVHQVASTANCTLTSHIPADLPTAIIDPTIVVQVLSILLNHAIQFTAQKVVCVSVYADTTSITVCVGDEGAPSNTSLTREIQLPVDRIKGCLGIELLICMRLIRLHHGRIWASQQTRDQNINLNFSVPLIFPAHKAK